jgi:hypothetical protein
MKRSISAGAVLLVALCLGSFATLTTTAGAEPKRPGDTSSATSTTPSAVAKEPKATARSDFNNDGFDDLAIGHRSTQWRDKTKREA